MSRIEVKICGLTRGEDVVAAAEAGADYIGLNFHPPSPRFVTPARARELVAALPAGVAPVGVFVNMAPAAVREIAAVCGLRAVQIHGDEPPDGFEDVGVPVWRAIRVGRGVSVPDPAGWPAARYVADAFVSGEYGGTGVAADWPEAARLARLHPLMLGGGLTPGNVASAVRSVRPLGVDVASGVEARPGIKDHDKIRRFIACARGEDCIGSRGGA
jgi:phosphoribosylanthranilate isomerase